MFLFRPFLVVLVCLSCISCAGKPDRVKLQHEVDTLDRAVIVGQKTPQDALSDYAALAKKYPHEPIAVAAYAEGLRRVGQAKESADTLRPLIQGKDVATLDEPLFMAYMRLLLGQGYFKEVEIRSQKRLVMSKGNESQLYNLLGVALAGQGKKTQAEQAFKKALMGWDGRAGVVEKNLEKLKAR